MYLCKRAQNEIKRDLDKYKKGVDIVYESYILSYRKWAFKEA